MEQFFLQVLSQWWVIVALFVVTFLGFLWKWIPAIFKKFEDITNEHKAEVKENQKLFQIAFDVQRVTFEETMTKIVATFNEQINKSNDWHEKHQASIVEINGKIDRLNIR